MLPIYMHCMKIDKRPKKGAWAPGDYVGTCCQCGEKFIGDKRAQSCANCAYGGKSCALCIKKDEEIKRLQKELCELRVLLEAGQCRITEPSADISTKQGRNGKGRAELKKRVLSLHLANPTLKDSEIARHFDIAPATVARYLAVPHKHE